MTQNDTFLPSTPSPTQNPQYFPTSQTQYSPPSSLPIMLDNNNYDANYGFNNNEKIMGFDQIHDQLYNPSVNDVVVSQIGTSNNNNNNSNINPMMSMSQDCSSIEVNNNCELLQDQVGDHESVDPLLDFGFGFPHDHENGLNNCPDKVGDFGSSFCFSEWVDFSHADIKPY